MFRDLLSSRWFQGGLAFFVLVVGGSLLYSWHVHRTTEAEFGKRRQPVVLIENRSPSTNTAPIDFQTEGFVKTSDETTDPQMSDETEALPHETEFSDLADAFLPDDMVSEAEAPAEDVPVSPFGFGPYPEVPADFPESIQIPWLWDELQRNQLTNHMKDFELLARVLIELWNEGDTHIIGGTIDSNTKVFPYYPNVAYVRYDTIQLSGGRTKKVIKRLFGPPGLPKVSNEQLISGDIPSLTLVDETETGIDPYTFLNIK